jgi:hypothetical protein
MVEGFGKPDRHASNNPDAEYDAGYTRPKRSDLGNRASQGLHGMNEIIDRTRIFLGFGTKCLDIVLHDAYHTIQFFLEVPMIIPQARQVGSEVSMQLLALLVPEPNGITQRINAADHLAHLLKERVKINIRHSCPFTPKLIGIKDSPEPAENLRSRAWRESKGLSLSGWDGDGSTQQYRC